MTRNATILLIPIVLLLARPASASGERTGALYLTLRETAFVEGGLVRLGEIAALSGGSEQDRQRAAECRLELPVSRLTLLPARAVRAALVANGFGDVSISGSRVAVIPSRGMAARRKVFSERLLRAVDEVDGRKEARIEVELLGTSGFDAETVDADVRVSILQVDSALGSPAGWGRVGVQSGASKGVADVWLYAYLPITSLGAGEAASAELEVSTVRGAGPTIGTAHPGTNGATGGRSAPLVRAGDPVTIVFRRGSVVVVSPGRAQTSGALQESVTVRPVDGRTSFTGTVMSSTEVAVDLP